MSKPVYDIGQVCELDRWETFQNGQPNDIFTRLRKEAPVYWHEEYLPFENGFWALTKHEDIVRVQKIQRLSHQLHQEFLCLMEILRKEIQ